MGDFLACFRQELVFGKIPTQLNDDLLYRIGRSVAQTMTTSMVVIGRDSRPTSESLSHSAGRGVMDAGSHTINIGVVSPEELAFACQTLGADAAVLIGSDQPIRDCNGLRIIMPDGMPMTDPQRWHAIEYLAAMQGFTSCSKPGGYRRTSVREQWLQDLLQRFTPVRNLHLHCLGDQSVILQQLTSIAPLIDLQITASSQAELDHWQQTGVLPAIPATTDLLIMGDRYHQGYVPLDLNTPAPIVITDAPYTTLADLLAVLSQCGSIQQLA